MTGQLTVAGIKFCAALLGVSQPTYDDCSKAMWYVGISRDQWYRSPTVSGSMPNPFQQPVGYKECVVWSEYDIYDGSKGSSYFCWRPARFIFDMGTATFHWELE